jgi:hypothetical protein
MVHMMPHAIELGISAFSAANLLATVGGLLILGKILLGRAGDIVGSKQTLILGFILMFGALTWLVPARATWMLFLIAGMFGFAYGGCAVSHSPIIAFISTYNPFTFINILYSFSCSQFYQKILPNSKFKESTVVKAGSWYVPTRRPLDCMTVRGSGPRGSREERTELNAHRRVGVGAHRPVVSFV